MKIKMVFGTADRGKKKRLIKTHSCSRNEKIVKKITVVNSFVFVHQVLINHCEYIFDLYRFLFLPFMWL